MAKELKDIKHGEKILDQIRTRPQFVFEIAQSISFDVNTVQACLTKLLKSSYVVKDHTGRWMAV